MTNVLLLGNYSTGKSSIINYIAETFGSDKRAIVGLCETTKEKISYEINNINFIDMPGLNTESVSIEDFRHDIVTAAYIWIIVSPSTFKSKDVSQYIKYCMTNRTYNNKNIYVILNKVDELQEEPKSIQSVLDYFENMQPSVFAISAKYHKQNPTPEFVNFIKTMINNSDNLWIRNELFQRIPDIMPYNRYIEKLPLCKWDRQNWGRNDFGRHIIKNCYRIERFIGIITEHCKIIKKYGNLLTNVNFEMLYVISNEKIHETHIQSITEYHKCCSITQRETTECLIDFDTDVIEDYGIIKMSGLYYYVHFSTMPEIKIFDYHVVDVDEQTIAEFYKKLNTKECQHCRN